MLRGYCDPLSAYSCAGAENSSVQVAGVIGDHTIPSEGREATPETA